MTTDIDTNTLAQMAAEDLGVFCHMMYPPFERAHHIDVLLSALEAVERGECKRLMITMPPRHSKSLVTSQLFPAWYLGRNPTKYIISSSYNTELAQDFAEVVRNLMRDEPRYHGVFPNTVLRMGSQKIRAFKTTLGGVYFATGMGGAVTGRGAHLFIVDDPIKGPEEAESETYKKRMKNWFKAVALTRLMPHAAIIVIQTRWNEDDLIGWLLNPKEQAEVDDWKIINFPAIAEENEGWRDKGDPLWPKMFDLKALLKIKIGLGLKWWHSLYQQNPRPDEGAIFPYSYFNNRFEWNPDRLKQFIADRAKGGRMQYPAEIPIFMRVIFAMDCAYEDGKENDGNALTVWGETEAGLMYLLDGFCIRADLPTLITKVTDMLAIWKPNAAYIEKTANGLPLIKSLKTNVPLIAVETGGKSKIARAYAITPHFAANKIWFPQARFLPFVVELVENFTGFPNLAHDDIVDSGVIAIARSLFSSSTDRAMNKNKRKKRKVNLGR